MQSPKTINYDRILDMNHKEMQEAIAEEVGRFHRKIDLCRYRKVIKGRIHCKKKNETYNFNNFCMGCEFLPKLSKITSLESFFC